MIFPVFRQVSKFLLQSVSLALGDILQHCHCYSRRSSIYRRLYSAKPQVTSLTEGFCSTNPRRGRDSLCSRLVGHCLRFSILNRAGWFFLFFSNAGFFLWIDLSKCLDPGVVETKGEWDSELELSQQLQAIGVEMSSGHAYHDEVAGWFRVIFSVEREILEEGLARLVQPDQTLYDVFGY